jgi:hypothetical protein
MNWLDLGPKVCRSILREFGMTSQGENSGELPSDFKVVYEWREGSLPPPHYYQFEIVLLSSGEGRMTMVPDYPSPLVPVWSQDFPVAPAALYDFYAFLLNGRVFELCGLEMTSHRSEEARRR